MLLPAGLGLQLTKSSCLPLYLAATIMLLLHLGASQQCVPYQLSSFSTVTRLHCTPHLAPCHQVAPSDEAISLDQTEIQLGNVLSQIEAAVVRGDLSKECVDGFLALYCIQSYHVCRQEVGGVLAPVGVVVCEVDCVGIVSGDCGGGGWEYLSRIVEQLRASGLVQLQPLIGSDECNVSSSSSDEQSCFSLTSPEECTTSTSPPTSLTTSPSSPSTGTIVTIVIVVALTLIAVVTLATTTLILLILTRHKKKSKPRTPTPITTSLTNNDQTDNAMADERRRGTLMMQASVVHEALLNPNHPPRSTTLARQMKSSSFLCLSPKQRLKQLEYPRGNICLLRDLWETNFGPVYMGEASGLDPKEDLSSVFIKSLRDRASYKLKQQFVLEMTWASGFSHPHIISLLGVCTQEEPNYMIFEYLDYGSLKEFLQSIGSMCFDFDQFLGDADSTNVADTSLSQSVFGVEDLTTMACQVADGMDYLAKKAFVLKDLAARNCQVGHNLVVKIANFGLNYDRQSDEYCCIRSHKNTPMPLRWLAPESIRHNKFSVYSDIWAYGILLWEIFSFGTRPYAELSNVQVVKSILSGQVLACPEKCPDVMYTLMQRCWSTSPSKRPWFHVIRTELMAEVQGKGERKAPPTPDMMRALRASISN